LFAKRLASEFVDQQAPVFAVAPRELECKRRDRAANRGRSLISLMRILTINFNGIRSAASKGFFRWAATVDADVICAQEVRAQDEHLLDPALALLGYRASFHLSRDKKAYSGVAIYAKKKPDAIIEGFGHDDIDSEGRYLEARFGRLSVASVYLPSGSSSELRQSFKFDVLKRIQPWLDAKLSDGRAHVLCGDFNIAHQPIDLKNWRGNQKNSGFLPDERAWFGAQLERGWVDTHRRLLGPEQACYTWWSNRGQAYANDVGWRIDYQLATPNLADKLKRAEVYRAEKFSDHAPLIVDYAGALASHARG
jgi:exodeoxyribonuclease III